jgi:hypothetical protein
MVYNRIFVIGPVKGDFVKFINVWEKIDFQPEQDLAVFLGDYIGSGDGNVDIMRWVMEHQTEKNMVFLPGENEGLMYLAEEKGDEEMKSLWMEDKDGYWVDEAIWAQKDCKELYEDWMYFLHCLDLKDSFQLSLGKTKIHFVSRAWNLDEGDLGSGRQIVDAHLLEDSGAVINPNYPDGQVVIYELLAKTYYMSSMCR